MIAHSATLAINERIAARQAAGERIVNLGFGEAGLPVPPMIEKVLADAAGLSSYAPVAGSLTARTAAAGYFQRRGMPTTADQVVFAPGSKALLFGLISAIGGDVVLPVPSWVSYAAQVALTGHQVIGVPIPAEAGGVPDPQRLPGALAEARRRGLDPRVLVVTVPDNPTGTYASPDLVREVCELARAESLLVISDEIYRDLTYEPAGLRGPGEIAPDHVIVTTGLSKQAALGGYRIGFTRLPNDKLLAPLIGLASEVWSCMPTPMQAVAECVLAEPPELVAHVAAARRLHGLVSQAVYERFVAAGATGRRPTAGFYLYPDFGSLPTIHSGAELAEVLLERHGIGVLAGSAFGDDPAALRCRVATSLLYGRTAEERWSALASANPIAEPWISEALETIDNGLAALRC
ncbi:pyridoxal phosphate-dependent aminotransferase [Fodinicola acaciae]|uniref:pyridoxal phosphate-dependent aminotransferase n=1 Tax=Fodinicola acaciae TaxID=2681555 RepID=UPI0013D5A79F|nr:pyridoxal phosphate-dependent aminotransferase [Fodinicola acaciae]